MTGSTSSAPGSDAARSHLGAVMADSQGFLARFAQAADQFAETGHWWTRLVNRRSDRTVDLKKIGSFPIVHGVRALALQADGPAIAGGIELRAPEEPWRTNRILRP